MFTTSCMYSKANGAHCIFKTVFGVFLISAKLLVTTGEQSGSSKSEIVDLQNPNLKCKDWANYPFDRLYYATGQVIGNYAFICGFFIIKLSRDI